MQMCCLSRWGRAFDTSMPSSQPLAWAGVVNQKRHSGSVTLTVLHCYNFKVWKCCSAVALLHCVCTPHLAAVEGGVDDEQGGADVGRQVPATVICITQRAAAAAAAAAAARSLCHYTSPSPLILSLYALAVQACARVPRHVAPAEQGRPEGAAELVGAVEEVAVQGVTIIHRRKKQEE